jgi:hypothetical protein
MYSPHHTKHLAIEAVHFLQSLFVFDLSSSVLKAFMGRKPHLSKSPEGRSQGVGGSGLYCVEAK